MLRSTSPRNVVNDVSVDTRVNNAVLCDAPRRQAANDRLAGWVLPRDLKRDSLALHLIIVLNGDKITGARKDYWCAG